MEDSTPPQQTSPLAGPSDTPARERQVDEATVQKLNKQRSTTLFLRPPKRNAATSNQGSQPSMTGVQSENDGVVPKKALDDALADASNVRPATFVLHGPKKQKAPASGQGSRALMLGAQATASISPPSAPPAAPALFASSTPLPKSAPDPALGRLSGKDPVRNNGATFTLLSTPRCKLVQSYRQTVFPMRWVLTCF